MNQMRIEELLALPAAEQIAHFRAWVERQRHDEPVGRTRRALYCPASRWLQETTGRPIMVCVGELDVRNGTDDGWTPYPLPSWLAIFIQTVDLKERAERLVGVDEVLTILNTIPST